MPVKPLTALEQARGESFVIRAVSGMSRQLWRHLPAAVATSGFVRKMGGIASVASRGVAVFRRALEASSCVATGRRLMHPEVFGAWLILVIAWSSLLRLALGALPTRGDALMAGYLVTLGVSLMRLRVPFGLVVEESATARFLRWLLSPMAAHTTERR